MFTHTVEPFEVDVNGRVVACECCVFGSTDCSVYTVGVRLADSGEALGTGVWDIAHARPHRCDASRPPCA